MAFASNIQAMNAAKAAMKAKGLVATSYKEFFSIEKHDGEWHSLQIQAFPAPRDPLQCLVSEREGAFYFPDAAYIESNRPASQEAIDEGYEADQAEADAIANSQQSAAALPNGKEWIRISSVAKPTKYVWEVADEMNAAARQAGRPAPTRKEVQDECIRRGVASGTARTQYQAWKKASDNAAQNSALAAELSAKFNKRS
jgi:hypothetical protein